MPSYHAPPRGSALTRLPYKKQAHYAAKTWPDVGKIEFIASFHGTQIPVDTARTGTQTAEIPYIRKIKNFELEVLPAMGTTDYAGGLIGLLKTPLRTAANLPSGWVENWHDDQTDLDDIFFWSPQIFGAQFYMANPNWQAPRFYKFPNFDVTNVWSVHLVALSSYKAGGAPGIQCFMKYVELAAPVT